MAEATFFCFFFFFEDLRFLISGVDWCHLDGFPDQTQQFQGVVGLAHLVGPLSVLVLGGGIFGAEESFGEKRIPKSIELLLSNDPTAVAPSSILKFFCPLGISQYYF